MIKTFVLLSLLAGVASADVETFLITLTATSDIDETGNTRGPLDLGGIFTTDGSCTVCTISADQTSVTSNGMLSFDITDAAGDLPSGLELGLPFEGGSATYDTITNTNTFSGDLFTNSNEIYQLYANGTYYINEDGDVTEIGTFSVSAIPEPSTWLLLSTSLILFSFAARRTKRSRALAVTCRCASDSGHTGV
jgi:hypothetical protein